MKKKKLILLLLISSTGLLITACTTNDNQLMEPEGKILSKTVQHSYSFGNLYEKMITIYENNRPKIDSTYNSNGELTYYTKWTYNTVGLLTSLKSYQADGQVVSNFSIDYGNTGKIIKHSNTVQGQNGVYEAVTEFVYNSDNTISANTTDSNGHTTLKKYYLNSQGLIFKKELVNDRVIEVMFDGQDNIIKETTSFINNAYAYSYTYTYDDVILMQGTFLNFWKNLMGSEVNNAVLFNVDDLYFGANVYGNKFLVKREGDSTLDTTEYIFDNENYPISSNQFSHNTLESEVEYIYE